MGYSGRYPWAWMGVGRENGMSIGGGGSDAAVWPREIVDGEAGNEMVMKKGLEVDDDGDANNEENPPHL